jgi:pyruvate dehydrogenase E2 component (dihydrolipoamide acetyltransferase)
LRFKIVDEPTDPPEVSDWSWVEPNSMTSAETRTDNDASVAEEDVESKSEVKATPAATRKAKELGVDLSMVEGTGSAGRITVQDVESSTEQQEE